MQYFSVFSRYVYTCFSRNQILKPRLMNIAIMEFCQASWYPTVSDTKKTILFYIYKKIAIHTYNRNILTRVIHMRVCVFIQLKHWFNNKTGFLWINDTLQKRIQSNVCQKIQNLIFFFLLHPKSYYNLSLCVTFSNTFDNLWKSWRVRAQWHILYKL